MEALLLFGLIPIVLVIVVVFADIKSRKGYGLVSLALVIVALFIAGILTNYHPEGMSFYSSSAHPFAGIWVALTVLVEMELFFLMGLTGLLVAAISRQWGWLIGVFVSLLPMLGLALMGTLPNSPASYQHNSAVFYLALFCPLALCLIYGIARIMSQRPTIPSLAQP